MGRRWRRYIPVFPIAAAANFFRRASSSATDSSLAFGLAKGPAGGLGHAQGTAVDRAYPRLDGGDGLVAHPAGVVVGLVQSG